MISALTALTAELQNTSRIQQQQFGEIAHAFTLTNGQITQAQKNIAGLQEANHQINENIQDIRQNTPRPSRPTTPQPNLPPALVRNTTESFRSD